jgi:chromosome segregation ATPase
MRDCREKILELETEIKKTEAELITINDDLDFQEMGKEYFDLLKKEQKEAEETLPKLNAELESVKKEFSVYKSAINLFFHQEAKIPDVMTSIVINYL